MQHGRALHGAGAEKFQLRTAHGRRNDHGLGNHRHDERRHERRETEFTHLKGPTGATTSGGSIELSGCEGPLKVDTSGGRIEAVDGSGSLDARTSGGSIVVRNFGGDAKVETSGGRLAFENVNGKIFGRTSGGSISAKLKSPVPGDVNLETSAGSIDVRFLPMLVWMWKRRRVPGE